tara:strand:+ start:173 stop:403 length:231 start_codon:yes stop_codon:yes gene_type:complete
MVNALDECTPHDLHLEIRSLDCTQDRAHKIRRYAYKVSREQTYDEDGGLAWVKLAEAVDYLWGDYEYWHTYDRRGF